jgi:anaerobic nitric oxide reductase transcription regulator
MDPIDVLIGIALDLTSALNAENRYQRLLDALRRVIAYDAAALLRIEGDELSVKAARGLTADAMQRRFARRDHPRLDVICNSRTPVHFPPDTRLPDPFDGLLADAGLADRRIHSCLGCPLFANDALIGVMTADAVDPRAFDNLDRRFLQAIVALAGAEMHTTDLMQALEFSAEKMGLIARDLMGEVQRSHGGEMIGAAPAMAHLKREIELVARSDFTILITGETGVGKELVARAIHAASNRSDRPMLYVNCASLPETLAESELFGHTRGAFTGAVAERTGKFELADDATLFLDEVGELPPAVQPKLLRVLQEGEIQKIGTGSVKHVDVRLIAATNRDLSAEVRSGRFRADLYHRLNVYPINVPPLRERREDIGRLAGHFCELTRRHLGIDGVRLEDDAVAVLRRYGWPGNVRELENVIRRSLLKASSGSRAGERVTVTAGHLGVEFNAPAETVDASVRSETRLLAPDRSLREAVDAFQKRLIIEAVDDSGGNWAAAARRLGLHRSNLHKLAGRLGIK